MLIKSIENKQTYLAWPSGEWSGTLLKAIQTAGIAVEGVSDRSYVFSVPALNIIATICRATDVPLAIQRITSRAVAGITGSDIIQEFNLSTPDSLENNNYYSSTAFPYECLVDNPPEPTFRWGVTPNAEKKFGKEPTFEQLASGVIFTSLPRIAQKRLRSEIDRTLPIVENPYQLGEVDEPRARIEKVTGKVEGLWRMYRDNYLVADVVGKGETAKANEIKLFGYPILDMIWLKMVTSLEKASTADLTRLTQLRDIVGFEEYQRSDRK